MIHQETCHNIAEIRHNPEKISHVNWAPNVSGEFLVDVRVEVESMTAMEPAKFVPIEAVQMSAAAELAPIGPKVRTIVALRAPVGTIGGLMKLPMHLAVDLTFDLVAAIEIVTDRVGDRGRGARQY